MVAGRTAQLRSEIDGARLQPEAALGRVALGVTPPQMRSSRPKDVHAASGVLLASGAEPAAVQATDLVDGFAGEAVGVDLQALQVPGQPHLEPEDLQ